MFRESSRNNMFSVMGNTGFGDLTIHRGDCTFILPQKHIRKDGCIPVKIRKHIFAGVPASVEKLKSFGVTISHKNGK